MALVPGLTPDTPFTTGGSQASDTVGRTQVQDPTRDPQLAVVASPVDTYARPATSQLAEALSSLNPALAAYADASQQKRNDDIQGQVAAKLLGQPKEKVADIIKTDPLFRNALALKLGTAMVSQSDALDLATGLQKDYAEGNIKPEDFEGESNRRIQALIQEHHGDPTYARQFKATFEPLFNAVRSQRDRDAIQANVETQDAVFSRSVQADLEAVLAKGGTAEDLDAAIRATQGSIKGVSGRPIGDLQKIVLGVIADQADALKDPNTKDYEKRATLLNGLLALERKDGNQNFGSFLSSPTLGASANAVKQKIDGTLAERGSFDNADQLGQLQFYATQGDPRYTALRDQIVKDHPNWLTAGALASHNATFADAQVRAARQTQELTVRNSALSDALQRSISGGIQSVTDVTYPSAEGGTKVYSRDEIIKDAARSFEANLQTKYAGDPNAPQKVFNDEVKWYTLNGVENPVWKGELSAGYSATTTAIAAGGTPNQTALQGYDLYKRLEGTSSGVTGNLLDKDTQAFYASASVFEQEGGFDAKSALQYAARAASDPEWKNASPGLKKSDFVTAAQNAVRGGWFSGNQVGDAWNSDAAVTEVSELAYAINQATGKPLDKVIPQAGELIKKHWTLVNGSAVYTGALPPDDFSRVATQYENDWKGAHAADFKRLGIDPSDVAMVSVGHTNQYSFVLKSYNSPLPIQGANLTTGMLLSYDGYKRKQALADSNKAVNIPGKITELKNNGNDWDRVWSHVVDATQITSLLPQ